MERCHLLVFKINMLLQVSKHITQLTVPKSRGSNPYRLVGIPGAHVLRVIPGGLA